MYEGGKVRCKYIPSRTVKKKRFEEHQYQLFLKTYCNHNVHFLSSLHMRQNKQFAIGHL